jgi:hypothetical protein
MANRYLNPGRDRAVALYDHGGRLVRVLKPEGSGSASGKWDAEALRSMGTAPGVYLWRTLADRSTAGKAGLMVLP